jgi:hypothetical protein
VAAEQGSSKAEGMGSYSSMVDIEVCDMLDWAALEMSALLFSRSHTHSHATTAADDLLLYAAACPLPRLIQNMPHSSKSLEQTNISAACCPHQVVVQCCLH